MCLSEYDTFKVADATHAVHPKDELWMASSEDTEEMVRAAIADPVGHATTFGPAGTYWDHLQDIAARGIDLRTLANLDVPGSTIKAILEEAGFTGYRLNGASEWIEQSLSLVKGLVV